MGVDRQDLSSRIGDLDELRSVRGESKELLPERYDLGEAGGDFDKLRSDRGEPSSLGDINSDLCDFGEAGTDLGDLDPRPDPIEAGDFPLEETELAADFLSERDDRCEKRDEVTSSAVLS